LPANYITGSNRIYEQTAQVDAKFDRALVYRSQRLSFCSHQSDRDFSPDPRVGRLTANTFLHFNERLIHNRRASALAPAGRLCATTDPMRFGLEADTDSSVYCTMPSRRRC